jgi:hypothetical protein
MAERRKKQRGLLDVVPEPSAGAVEAVPDWLDAASYDPTMLSYRLGTGLRNMLSGTAALPGLLSDVARGGMQKIRELSPPELRGRATPQSTETIDAATAMARQVAADPRSAVSQVLDYGRGILSSPGNVVEFLGENISPRPRGPRPVMQEIDVYHGSPHRFEEFDASKIGTGEGAQSYGYGIYLAESPKVARGYAKTTPYRNFERKVAQVYNEFDSPEDAMDALKEAGLSNQELLVVQALEKDDWLGFDYPHQALRAALRNPQDFDLSPETKSSLKNLSTIYTADLPDEMVDRMLDWDKRISNQPEFVQKAWADWRETPQAKKLIKQMMARGSSAQDIEKMFANPTGETMHKWIYEGYGSAKGGEMPKVAKFLKDRGLVGVKYQDAGSRGQGGSGTRNFVVFPSEEKKVKILKRE